MSRMLCPEPCDDCPLRELVPAERYELEQSEKTIAKGNISPKGNSVSFDFENGKPIGPHLVEVGFLPEGSNDGIGFWVDSGVAMSGVAKEIVNCSRPKRTGFLGLGKKICGAVSNFAEEV